MVTSLIYGEFFELVHFNYSNPSSIDNLPENQSSIENEITLLLQNDTNLLENEEEEDADYIQQYLSSSDFENELLD